MTDNSLGGKRTYEFLLFLLELSGPVYRTIVWALNNAATPRQRQEKFQTYMGQNYRMTNEAYLETFIQKTRSEVERCTVSYVIPSPFPFGPVHERRPTISWAVGEYETFTQKEFNGDVYILRPDRFFSIIYGTWPRTQLKNQS